MDIQLLEKRFALIGARVKLEVIPEPTWRARPGIDIGRDKSGEFFDIKIADGDDVNYEVVNLQKDLRHLLLMARRGASGSKEKFLCGHDERHWFVCAVPGKSVASVENAMEALQPMFVRREVFLKLKRSKNRFDRRNEAFVRQGEWFFVPFPELVFDSNQIHKNEPISRGAGSKPHICEEVFRSGGEAVMSCLEYAAPVLQKHFKSFLKSMPEAKRWNWQVRRMNAAVYARGAVRHADHKTIYLDGWHQVFMNTESEAPGMRHVVFLD
ncbi:MAG: hypothetical protein M3384_01505 [Acidobacteriota bacterium]|nr:hypothetical protein [Acidobacteriota bacterium]